MPKFEIDDPLILIILLHPLVRHWYENISLSFLYDSGLGTDLYSCEAYSELFRFRVFRVNNSEHKFFQL